MKTKNIIILIIILFFLITFLYLSSFNIVKVRNKVNILFDKYSYNGPILDVKELSWSKNACSNYKLFLNEYYNFTKKYHKPYLFKAQFPKNGLLEDINNKWKSIILYSYNKKTDYSNYFPYTYNFFRKIPGVTMIMFSVMEPGAKLMPHIGPYKGVLRYHLALKTPKDYKSCYINIKDSNNQIYKYSWREGEAFYFDDIFEHWVENNTNEERIILFIDVKRKFKNIFINMLNNFILWIIKN